MARLPRFECLFCEHCCFFESREEMPTVLPWEKRMLEEIADEEGLKVEFEPILVYRDNKGRCAVALYRWVINGFCPFFDRETKRCRIHEKKPFACRMYPLLLELPTGRLMVSGKCEWVRRVGRRLLERLSERPSLIGRVFPAEIEAAKQVFVEVRSEIEFAERHGMVRVKSLEECREVYDMDDYVARYG